MTKPTEPYTFKDPIIVDCLVFKGVLITPSAPALTSTVSNTSNNDVLADIEVFLYFDNELQPTLSCYANGQFFKAQQPKSLEVNNGSHGFPDKMPNRVDIKAKITVTHNLIVKVGKDKIVSLK